MAKFINEYYDMNDIIFRTYIGYNKQVFNSLNAVIGNDIASYFYIGRGSKWGNPFIIGKDGDQNEVIRKYRERFENLRAEGSITDRDLIRLRGGRLGCYCSPLACHGDVLVEAIEALVKKRERNVF